MDAGKLNRRVILRSPGGTRDSLGERTTTWTNVATVWAAVTPLSVREQFFAGQMQTSGTHKIIIRYSSDVAAMDGSWSVLYGSRVFVVEGVRNINERGIFLEIICVEGLRQE